jgi:hypothetical protein
LSVGFLGRVLAAVAGFGSAVAMLLTAPVEQEARWARIPQDGRWYILEQPTHLPPDAGNRPNTWPQLVGGIWGWKKHMSASASSVCKLLRAFGVEPSCTLCNGFYLAFDAHTTSQTHFRVVHRLVEQYGELAREQLWHETCVVTGRVRYNQLDGELQVMRDVPLPEEPVTYPHELSLPGQWILVGVAAVVPVQPFGNKTKWPNMWNLKHWKEKMQRAAKRVVCILAANGAHNLSCCCLFCTDEYLSADHLLGPKHFFKLMGRVPEDMPVNTNNFWQTWTFDTGTSALAFNHADGTLRMVRQPDVNELVAPAAPAGFCLQSAEISSDPHERVLAAVRVLPQPPPPPLADEGFASSQPATSSTFAPPAAYMLLAPQQQQCATAGSTAGTVSPWGELPPAKHDAPAKLHTIGIQQPPMSGDGVFLWYWQQHAAREVKRLEEVLDASLDATEARYCELCQHSVLPSDSFAQHVARDPVHIAQVRARFEHQGPNGIGWVQCWARVAQLNHLTLDVSIEELRARGGGSEVATATTSGTDVMSRCVHNADDQLCAAVQQVAAASGGSNQYAVRTLEDPRTVPAAATQQQTFRDPTTGRIWFWNADTEEVSWSDEKDMESCGPTVSLDHTSDDGGQQHTSPIAVPVSGTGGDENAFWC